MLSNTIPRSKRTDPVLLTVTLYRLYYIVLEETHSCTCSLCCNSKLARRGMLNRFSRLVVCGEHNASDPRRPVKVFGPGSDIRTILVHAFGQISRQLRGMATLETLNFSNKALKDLPVDPNPDNRQRQVSGACFSKVREVVSLCSCGIKRHTI